MKRLLVLLLLLLPSAWACESIKDIRLTSVSLASVTPDGLTRADAVVDVGISNPAPSFVASGITGKLLFDETALIEMKADDFKVAARRDSVYSVPMKIMLSGGLNLLTIGRMLDNADDSRYQVEITAKCGPSAGVGKVIVYKRPLKTIWEKFSSR